MMSKKSAEYYRKRHEEILALRMTWDERLMSLVWFSLAIAALRFLVIPYGPLVSIGLLPEKLYNSVVMKVFIFIIWIVIGVLLFRFALKHLGRLCSGVR